MSTLLDSLLSPGALRVAFQPIVRVGAGQARLHALEGLVRGPLGSNLERADVLFEYVRRKREELQVDRACLRAVLAAAGELRGELCFSINAHANTLARDPGFRDFLLEQCAQHGLLPSQLILEIVEHGPQWADRTLLRALDRLRDEGLQVALDDVGLGQSNYRMIVDCHPDYFKIDRWFVTGAAQDFRRLAVIDSIAQLAARFGAQAVAEGVESRADLTVVRERGIELVQGHLFAPALPGEEALARQALACEGVA
jgi:EAL domain-containing protein (putative c-di-GMP-specific phosphodiesterase class I)